LLDFIFKHFFYWILLFFRRSEGCFFCWVQMMNFLGMKKSSLKNSDREQFQQQKLSFYVQEVIDFSSQYGKENTKSYTISNIRSAPIHYPSYGDFLESCVLVKYNYFNKLTNYKNIINKKKREHMVHGGHHFLPLSKFAPMLSHYLLAKTLLVWDFLSFSIKKKCIIFL